MLTGRLRIRGKRRRALGAARDGRGAEPTMADVLRAGAARSTPTLLYRSLDLPDRPRVDARPPFMVGYELRATRARWYVDVRDGERRWS